MKKSIFIAVAVLAGTAAFAQKKSKQPPPPPPPPVVNVNEIPPPPPPPPPPPKVKMDLPKDYQVFLKRNPTVKRINWNNNEVRIRLKSGKEEVFDMNNKDDVEKLKNQYGELPAPPPPPPPPAPKVSKQIIES